MALRNVFGDLNLEATQTAIKNLIASFTKAEDSAHNTGDFGIPLLGLRSDSDTTTADNGDYTLIKMDEEGRAKVSTKPASFPLVIGTITTNGGTVFCDVRRSSNVMITMVATSLVGHNVSFEGSIDSTNGTDGNWVVIQVGRSNANTIETTSGVLAATPVYAWEASVNGYAFVRVRATAHTSGTATWKFQQGSYATEPIPLLQTHPVSLVAPSNVGLVAATTTSGSNTFVKLIGANTTNATSVKTTSGVITELTLSNIHTAAVVFKLYNKASAPVVGTDVPAKVIVVPAGQTVSVQIGYGLRLSTGIAFATTLGVVDTDTTVIPANTFVVSMSYT